eukprot:TRINITY_DN1648_c0_g2_i1.p2 TRINITY_DN1648_c0_g2~~TRINITY_DN1648_c0_g2_i1.p2  ORF type:complete len:121 (-),score=15.15 TRINITY_DN1648_c0_g2_i1:228-590(-)
MPVTTITIIITTITTTVVSGEVLRPFGKHQTALFQFGELIALLCVGPFGLLRMRQRRSDNAVSLIPGLLWRQLLVERVKQAQELLVLLVMRIGLDRLQVTGEPDKMAVKGWCCEQTFLRV